MPSVLGVLFCLASAVAFGAMGIFGKLAYEEGATVGTLLAVRFALAAVVFWALVAATSARRRRRAVGGAAPGARRLRVAVPSPHAVAAAPARRGDVLRALALGAVGYSLQAGCFFAALERMDASLLSLLLYTFPAMVTVAAIALGRARASVRTAVALVSSSSGLVLVLAGAGSGALDPLGAVLGVGAAAVYTTYILTSEGVAARLDPLRLSALVCTGATVTLAVVGVLTGGLRPGAVSVAGWGWLVAIAFVSTVAAVGLFFAGLRRVGATSASILSTAEPVTTVVLAFAVFGEAMGPTQLLGGALVLAAVGILSARPLRRRAPWPRPLVPQKIRS